MTLAVSTVIKSLKDTLMISNLIKALIVKIQDGHDFVFLNLNI